MASHNGLNSYPQVVAELGPGDSLGIGLAAILSGTERYYAFDVVEHANIDRNLKIFDELVSLFKSRADIPGNDEFPRVKPFLETYKFPKYILTDNRLNQALVESRISKIRNAIKNPHHGTSMIKYRVPWFDLAGLEKENIEDTLVILLTFLKAMKGLN